MLENSARIIEITEGSHQDIVSKFILEKADENCKNITIIKVTKKEKIKITTLNSRKANMPPVGESSASNLEKR